MPRIQVALTLDMHPIVLTADRTLMSDYGKALFLGFLAPGPRTKFFRPELLYRFVLRKVSTTRQGCCILAPQGLRRIESGLIQAGFQVIIAPPWKLSKIIDESTKVIGICAFDPLGMGPASTTFSGRYGASHAESNTAASFRELVRSKPIQRARARGALVILGGPGAWQISPQVMRNYGIDLTIIGEAELIFPELVRQILDQRLDLELPEIIRVPPEQIPSSTQIPRLVGATIGGAVEISRGCGRGCSFCLPTLQKLRHRPIQEIIADAQLNISFGQTHICLTCEDLFQYGGYPLRKNPNAVLELISKLKSLPGISSIGFAHANLASIVELSWVVEQLCQILGLDGNHWLGFQTGIETGSPRLISKLMKYKPAPFSPQEWPQVVIQAFGICMDNGLVPCGTLIVNLPGEQEQDVLDTLQLVRELRSYRSLLVPLLYVPAPGEAHSSMRLIEDASWYHLELYKAIWEHDMRWLPGLARDYLSKSNPLTKLFAKLLLEYVIRYAHPRVIRLLDELISSRR